MSKTTSCIVSLCIALIFATPVLAQIKKYPIVATRGKTALFRTPEDPPYRKGQILHVYRKIQGKGRLIAHARVVLIDKKFSGVRLTRAILSDVLKKGDLLVIPRKKAAKPTARPSEQPGQAPTLPETTDRREPLAHIKPTLLVNTAKPQFGASLGALMPTGLMAENYSPALALGLQMRSSLRFNTSARLAVQFAPISPSSTQQSRQNQSGTTQKTTLLMVTASLQPRLSGHFLLDLGVGFYRQQDDWDLNGYQYSSVSNALASIFGFGYMFRMSERVSMLLLLSGNVYYPEQGSSAFFSVSTAWLFGI